MYKTLTTAFFIVLGIQAAEADYRAEGIQILPNGTEMRAHVAVSDQAMRNEFVRNGETVVQIFRRDTGQQTLLFPARKTYMQSPAGEPVPKKRNNPCEGLPGASCIEQGRETIAGREAVKWQMTVQTPHGKQVSTQWLDAARGMPLRMQGPNGESAEARLLGKETMLGREVEKWEITSRMPNNGQTLTGRQWYDPGLDTHLREELPDGTVREFKTLEVKELPADLFSVPAGFTRVEPGASTTPPASR